MEIAGQGAAENRGKVKMYLLSSQLRPDGEPPSWISLFGKIPPGCISTGDICNKDLRGSTSTGDSCNKDLPGSISTGDSCNKDLPGNISTGDICNKDLPSAHPFKKHTFGQPPGCIRNSLVMPDIPNKSLKTGVKRIQTTDKDLESDKIPSGCISTGDICNKDLRGSISTGDSCNKDLPGNISTGNICNKDLPSANPFMPSANPFMPSANPFMPSANSYMPSANSYMPSANPFMPSANPFMLDIPNKALKTGVKRIQTTDKDLESDKSEIVKRYPKRHKHVGPSAAANKKTGGNGEASDDQSSNQATDGDSDPDNSSIFVDNLGTNGITAEHLRQIFAPFGELLCVVILAGTQCGYAEFLSRRSAEEAIRNLNGTELAGQTLRLSFAKDEVCSKAIAALGPLLLPAWAKAVPPVSDPVSDCWLKTYETSSYDQSSNQATHIDTGPMTAFRKSIEATHVDRDPKIPNNTSILVDNLVPNVVTEEQLRQSFTTYGEVAYVKIMEGTQFGFVQFVSRSSAEEAIRNMNGKELAGQNLKLSFSNKEERGAEYLNNGLPYGWSGSGIFRGLPPLCSDSGLPTSGWFSAPSPFMCDKVIDPEDPRMEPTKEDVESDDTLWALYKRWCKLNKVCRTPEEMHQRFGYFKESAIEVYETNRDRPHSRCGLYIWSDDPSKCPRGGVII